MSKNLKYVPVFRGLQEEMKVLKTFDFGKRIYPCIEIIKEIDRATPKRKPKKNSKKIPVPKPEKTFEEVYLPFIESINAEKVFIDLPVHLNPLRSMKPEAISFLNNIVGNRIHRTEYMKKFSALSSRIIPVISSYFARTGHSNTIELQAKDLRKDFNILAFRIVGEDNFDRDILQIEKLISKNDYVIMDWVDARLDENDEKQQEIIDKLGSLNCNIVIHRNAIPNEIRNVDLIHTRAVDGINNNLIERFRDFSGAIFSDYSGIKRGSLGKGGGGNPSPGFIYYDASQNKFYGYKSDRKRWTELVLTIVPAVISSGATIRMRNHSLDYLSEDNHGWTLIQKIDNGEENGNYPAIYKNIAMHHYLHCMKMRISNGDFD